MEGWGKEYREGVPGQGERFSSGSAPLFTVGAGGYHAQPKKWEMNVFKPQKTEQGRIRDGSDSENQYTGFEETAVLKHQT
jgi:hypothetical protein